jgi:hypothetical protein
LLAPKREHHGIPHGIAQRIAGVHKHNIRAVEPRSGQQHQLNEDAYSRSVDRIGTEIDRQRRQSPSDKIKLALKEDGLIE